MELRQLRTFEAVVAHGTVTGAAVALGRAPSSVSEQIRALEKSLGVPLFDRTPAGLRLTAPGHTMLDWSRRLLGQADQALREVAGARPVLRFGALETIAAVYLPRALARLADRRPDIKVEVRSDADRSALLTAIATGDLDAALLLDTGEILGGLGFAVPPARLDFVDLQAVPLVLVSAPAHRLAGTVSLSRDDMRGEKLLVNSAPACSFSLAGQRLLGARVDRVAVGGVALMRACAEQGLGIALLPEFAVAGQLAAGTLVRLALDAPAMSLRLAWRQDREELPGLREMLYAASAA